MGSSSDDWADGPGLLASVRRYRSWVLLITLSCAVLAYGWSSGQPTQYAAALRVYVDTPGAQAPDPGRIVRTRAQFIQSPVVLTEAIRTLGGHMTVEDLKRKLTVGAVGDADLINIKALGPDPGSAARTANAIAAAYRTVVGLQARAGARSAIADLQRQEVGLGRQLTTVTKKRRATPQEHTLAADEQAIREQLLSVARLKQNVTERAFTASQLSPSQEQATASERPALPRPLRTAALGTALGLVLGSGLAWWLAGRSGAGAAQPGRRGSKPLHGRPSRPRPSTQPDVEAGPTTGDELIRAPDGQLYELHRSDEGMWRLLTPGHSDGGIGPAELSPSASKSEAHQELNRRVGPGSGDRPAGVSRRWRQIQDRFSHSGLDEQHLARSTRTTDTASVPGSSGNGTVSQPPALASDAAPEERPIEDYMPVDAHLIDDPWQYR